MASPHVRSNGAGGPRPQLPAFCRSRRPVVMVTASSIANVRLLVLLGLLFPLSTLLLVIAGPVPPRLAPATVTSPKRSRVVTVCSGSPSCGSWSVP